jgi:hypothetical protein
MERVREDGLRHEILPFAAGNSSVPNRFSLPDPEEQDFIARVNKKLPDGARVHAFIIAEAFANGEPHGLVMQYGGRRRSIYSASPFCHAAEDDIIAMVTAWIAGLAQRERWTTDERYAEGLL